MSSDALEACAAEPGKLTGHAPAGKFKEQLVLKQKQIEVRISIYISNGKIGINDWEQN